MFLPIRSNDVHFLDWLAEHALPDFALHLHSQSIDLNDRCQASFD